MPRTPALSPEVLNAALVGLESQRRKLENQISEVRRLLGVRGPGRPRATESTAVSEPAEPTRRKRRKMSAAARARIREAQKKRWAEFRAQQKGEAAPEKTTPKKRKLSPAGRKAIADAAKARWAALRQRKEAAGKKTGQRTAPKKAAQKTVKAKKAVPVKAAKRAKAPKPVATPKPEAPAPEEVKATPAIAGE